MTLLFRLLAVFRCILVIFAFAGFVSFGQAAETIHSFSSHIEVNVDGSVDVTETIRVRAEGRSIKRGIFRDLPLVYVNDDGSQMRPNFRLHSVEKDGEAEPFHTQSIRDGIRIYAGEEEVFLATGDYTYTLRYTLTRMVRRFEDHDELYWNATGTFWDFPITKAVAQVSLPQGANINGLAVYTGKFGETGEDAQFSQSSENHAVFRTTRPLDAKEGMSVAVLFDKGAIAPISQWQSILNYMADHRETVFPGIAALIILAYFFFAWDAVGRDPEKGTIIPLFHAPKGMSAALVHYVHHLGWKKNGWTAFSAALVSLATKGLITFDKSGDKTSFTHIGASVRDLPPGETVVNAYIARQGTLKVDKDNGKSIMEKRQEFIKAIESENREIYFNNNVVYTIVGVVLSIALLIGLVIIEALDPFYLMLAIVIGVGLGMMSNLFSRFWLAGGFSRFFLFVWLGLAGANLFGGFAALAPRLTFEFGLFAAISIVAINIVFGILMRAPTAQGRKIMDQIDGFKLYLETAEKERLKFVKEPEFTMERFEQILPYAVALGVEEKWGNRLAGELARNAIDRANRGYNPHWYHGSNFNTNNLGKDIAGIATGVSSAMIAAQPVSSSSSGGGGGGFSGGGGGGGGGGGW